MDPTVILVPVLRRPQNVIPLLESISSATPEPHRVLFLCSVNDYEELAAVRAVGADYLACGIRRPGDYARKINLGYHNTTEPLMFLAADDLRFHRGWLSTAISYLSDTVHVVGTNDLGNVRVMSGRHSTHSLVTREYVDNHGTIDRPRTVLTEVYPHCFTDDEFIQTAMYRNAFAFASDSIVEHLHPHWKKGKWDDVYQMADDSIRPGRLLFNRRRRMWMNHPKTRARVIPR